MSLNLGLKKNPKITINQDLQEFFHDNKKYFDTPKVEANSEDIKVVRIYNYKRT